MNTVVIDGVTYTKAGTLAKQFRYTTDYIGQLCRAGKVDAQLVGRSWYVSEDSLMDHAGKRIETLRQDEIALEDKSFSSGSADAVRVSAPLSKITKKMLQSPSSYLPVADSYSSTRYEADPVDLLPTMQIRPILPKVPAREEVLPAIKPLNQSNSIEDASFSVAINQHKPVKIELSNAEDTIIPARIPTVPISTKRVVNQLHSTISKPTRTSQVPSTATKTVSFTPASVVVIPARKSRHGVLALGLVLIGFGAVLTAIMLDVEVYYDGTISSTSFSLNQTALVNFFKEF